MNRAKTAEFLADCLSHMPDQPEQLQDVVDTVIAGLTRIANGQEWSRDESRAVYRAVHRAVLKANRAAFSTAYATTMAAAQAADWVSRAADRDAAYWAEVDEARAAIYWAAYWAALAHPDPDAERARQAKVREEMGL